MEYQDSTTNSWQISIASEGKKNFYTTSVSDKKWRPSIEVRNYIKLSIDDYGAAEFNRKGNELDKEFSRIKK